jgi:Na+-translocating ferredoxin:NAD+ oxidoreductase subunit B
MKAQNLACVSNNMSSISLISQVDALLPQTQCGECGYGGCLPYAKAMVEKDEAVNRCPPGGVGTLEKLGKILNRETSAFIAQMQEKEKPAQLAFIRETECIGCTKCIQACPVDAIIGSAKQLHTVLEMECTGCGLCVPPCPVDCIDLTVIEERKYQPLLAKNRFDAREKRKIKTLEEKKVKMSDPSSKALLDTTYNCSEQSKTKEDVLSKKNYIAEALARVKAKSESRKISF